MKLAKETWALFAIGLADLATTIIFIKHHGALEANPLFQRYWEMGLAAFITAKIALLVAPLAILEWARARRPRFVSFALRGAIGAYLGMYAFGCVRLNDPANADRELARLGAPPIVLSEHAPLHLRPTLQPIKQTSSAAKPEGVIVY